MSSHMNGEKETNIISLKNITIYFIKKKAVNKYIQWEEEKTVSVEHIVPSIHLYFSFLKKTDVSRKQEWRVVVGFRKLNEKTIYGKYSLPKYK